MTDIKPVAWCLVYSGPPANTDIHSDPTMNEYKAIAMAKLAAPSVSVAPLYPESAILQSREEGRREGMREAAEIANKWAIDRRRAWHDMKGRNVNENQVNHAAACASMAEIIHSEITRAAEGK